MEDDDQITTAPFLASPEFGSEGYVDPSESFVPREGENGGDRRGSGDAYITSVKVELQRSLKLLQAIALVVGVMIGSGIFASPGSVTKLVGSSGLSLFVWVLAGLLSLLGALCYAELGTMFPSSGGEYVYLTKGFGPQFGFLFVWCQFFVQSTGSQGIISIVFARYFSVVCFGADPTDENIDKKFLTKVVAILLLVVLTAVNCYSTKLTSKLQVVSTVLKLIAVAGLVVLGLVWLGVKDGYKNFSPFLEPSPSSFGAFGLAVIQALWSYDGWNQLGYVAEEVQNPSRNIPRAILIGIFTVIAVYLGTNASYFAVLGRDTVVNATSVATQVGVVTMGGAGKVIFSLLVCVSTLGAANGSIFSGSRVFFAAAREGQFPKIMAKLRKTGGTPYISLIAMFVWSSLLILVGDFSSLVNYFGFAMWIFYSLSVVVLMRMRIRERERARPYRVRPYPYVPIAFLIMSTALVLNSLVSSPVESVSVLAFMGASFLVYYGRIYYAKRRQKTISKSVTNAEMMECWDEDNERIDGEELQELQTFETHSNMYAEGLEGPFEGGEIDDGLEDEIDGFK